MEDDWYRDYKNLWGFDEEDDDEEIIEVIEEE